MWILIYLLIFLMPLGLIGLVFLVMIKAGVGIYKTGKSAYLDIKPYGSDLITKGKRVQQKGLEFADRGGKLADNFQELGGRWAFITEAIAEAKKSPLVKIAGVAGRVAASRESD
jgi:hypothetical protein